MSHFDEFLRGVVPNGFVLTLLLSLAIQALWLMPVVILLTSLRRLSSASTRHFAWLLVVSAMGILPLLAFGLPGSLQSAIPGPVQTLVQHEVNSQTAIPLRQKMVAKPQFQQLEQVQVPAKAPSDLKVNSKSLKAVVVEASTVNDQTVAGRVDTPQKPLQLSAVRVTELVLTGLWLAGSVLLSLRVFAGQISMWQIQRTVFPVSEERILSVASAVMANSHFAKKVRLLEHTGSSMPMTCGVWAPSIVLPSAAREWSTDRLRMVLLHELAHIRRHDCLWQWLTHIVTIGQWFNPLVWLATSRLMNEREQACDDEVLNTGVRASDYAETLLDLSTGGRRHVFELCAGLAMARPQRLAARIESIVDEHRNRRAVSRQAGLITGLCVCLMMLPLVLLAQADVSGNQKRDVEPGVDSGVQQQAKPDSENARQKTKVKTPAVQKQP